MENKTGRYFKYAVGEIILVVIGILIALQINNWNQKRLEMLKSQDYHQRIIEDLDFKINSLEGDLKSSIETRKYLLSTVEILQNGKFDEGAKDTLNFTLKNYFQFVRMDGNLNSYDEMKSSGHLGLIYNKELRKAIDKYLRYLSAVSKIYDQLADKVHNTDIIDKYVSLEIGENTRNYDLTYDFNQLKQDTFLINKLSRFALNWQTKKIFSENLISLSKELKVQIQKELKK